MEETEQHGVDPQQHGVDPQQVRKAADYLMTYCKNKEHADPSLVGKPNPMSLTLYLRKIHNSAIKINIPLPHDIRSGKYHICLFTRDEPDMSSEQTEEFYRNLLGRHGVTWDIKIFPLEKLKSSKEETTYYSVCLVDSRIHSCLPPGLGKFFYRKSVCKAPLPVDLQSEDLAAELNRQIQITQFYNSPGSHHCGFIRIGDTGMEVEALVENILEVAQVLAEKLPMGWKGVRALHLKSSTSVALPIYEDFSPDLGASGLAEKETGKKSKKRSKMRNRVIAGSQETEDQPIDEDDASPPHKKQNGAEDAAEGIS